MTIKGEYETFSGLPPSKKDYLQLVNDVTMLVCNLIRQGQALALRSTWATLRVIHELPPSQEEDSPATEGEEQEEDEVPLVWKRRIPQADLEPNFERVASGAAAGPFG